MMDWTNFSWGPFEGKLLWYILRNLALNGIHPTHGELFAFAGLMEDWQGPNGELMVSTCIITTTPNELMAEIHNRMPVLLPKEAWGLWLDPAAQTRELRPLLVPYPAKHMAAHPVGPGVGDVRNDGPELILPLAGTKPSEPLPER